MKIAICDLASTTNYSQSKYIDQTHLPKKNEEKDDAYEARAWRERCHVNKDGYIVIPPMGFKRSLELAARFLNLKIKGQGNNLWNKHFVAGTLVTDELILPIKKADVQGEWLFVPSDGKTGGGKRVMKCFPLIPSWKGKVAFYVIDDSIPKEIFEKVLRVSGNLIGIGRFRPERGGYYGRFSVQGIEWQEEE